jgi:PDDEXK-like domain of unknown function (DUF3799)
MILIVWALKMINLFDFMVLVRKTPFHFANRQKDFDLNEAVTLSLKSIYAFGRVYMHLGGKNQAQRETSRKNIIAIGKKPHDKKQSDLIKGIVQRLKSIAFLRDFKSADYHVSGIDLTIPFICHIENQEILVCVKTTRDASDRFENEIIREKHYVETALMRQAVGNHYGCFILAVEVDSPHAHAFFRIENNLLEQGDIEIKEKLELLSECQTKNSYPSYFGGGAKTITKPNYL